MSQKPQKMQFLGQKNEWRRWRDYKNGVKMPHFLLFFIKNRHFCHFLVDFSKDFSVFCVLAKKMCPKMCPIFRLKNDP